LKVLSTLGVADIVTATSPHLTEIRDKRFSGENLGFTKLPITWKQKYGQPICGVKRTVLNLALKEALIKEGIEVHEGWKLKDMIETDDSVTAVSEDGKQVKGSFLVGCDGIKAISRSIILAQHGVQETKVNYTGLIQTNGMSPTPAAMLAQPGWLNLYGPGAHFICYQASPEITSWAFTQRELTEADETWKAASDQEMELLRNQLLEQFGHWTDPVSDLISTSSRIIKYGLYDRPQLEPQQWYSQKYGRCVLIGDAAHPTSPHLGQGANQAMEDCYHLSQLLPDVEADSKINLSSEALTRIFSNFANLRQPRTAALGKGARAQGENRVVNGGSVACDERDERLRRAWSDKAGVEARFDSLLREPF
jgi:salicylate hydroxylase